MTQVKGFHSSEHLVFLQKEKKNLFLLLSHPSQQESEKLSSTQVKASGSFQQIPANLCDAQALCHSLREEEKKKTTQSMTTEKRSLQVSAAEKCRVIYQMPHSEESCCLE